ncbi:MAG: PAS domain S-box protein [Planctomycetes bacterium]|nr:PAS domain S-box protein [Planctomycetota bacterium]
MDTERLGDGTSPASDAPAFPVACLGASAGGVEALREVLGGLAPPLDLALLVIMHRDPAQAGHLQEVLGRATGLPVVDLTEGARLQPGQVCVAPADRLLELEGDAFVSARPLLGLERSRSLDHYLRALAPALGPRLIAVVLSGTGSDGALGVAEVKTYGGIVLAQDASARFDGMPRAATATGAVDLTLPPAAIAQELRRIAAHPYVRGRDEELATPEASPEEEERALREVLMRLRRATGVDFGHYKQATIRRRVRRRMALRRLVDVAEYARLLAAEPAELEALHQDVLIGVTGFFRDPEAFEALQRGPLAALVARRDAQEELRVWVPGCSTGEEVYSLAICLTEALGEQAGAVPVKLFGTDINGPALDRARVGYYPQDLTVDISAERLRRFFVKEGDGYRVVKPVRDLCVFARHDLTRDPPFSNLDLISCRNVLIYFDQTLQRRLLPLFHYALRPRGYLFLGPAESLGGHDELFDLVDKRHRIYLKNPGASRPVLQLPLARGVAPPDQPAAALTPQEPDRRLLRREAERVLIERCAARGVVVDERLQVLHVMGDTGPFLKLAPGDAELALLDLAREGLLLPLRQLIDGARAAGTACRQADLQVRTNDHFEQVSVEVIPLRLQDRPVRGFLVLFEAPAGRLGASAGRLAGLLGGLLRGRAPGGAAVRALAQLQEELAETRRYLHALLEEKEAANEELRAASEEALSSNEELLSANEELETAKEELQASNEELATVNDELSSRITETARVNDDLSNLISSIDLPIVMLDRERRIRRFTPAAARLFHLIAGDRGRAMRDLRPRLRLPRLEEDLTAVIERLEPCERDVQDEEGRWFHLAIRPYRTADDKVDGAVLTIVDVNALKLAAEENLRRLAAVVRDSNDAITLLDLTGHIVDWNRGAERMYGYSREEALRLTAADLAPPELREEMRAFVLRQAGGDEQSRSFETRRLTKDGRVLEVWLTTTVIVDDAGAIQGIATTERDVTQRRREHEALREGDRRKDEFLSLLGHELRNPISAITYGLIALRKLAQEERRLEAVRGTIVRMEHQAQLLARLVDDMLDSTRIARGELHLSMRPVDLVAVARHALAAAAPLLERKEQTAEVSLPEGPVLVRGDEHRLEQVLYNLLHNASKFSPRGRRVWLALDLREGAALLHVRDEGIGLDAADLARVFRGAGAEDERARPGRGLGLGLGLVRRLVELHGGRLEARSEGRGKGAEFEVCLPLARADDGAAAAGRRILVVEDEPDVAMGLEMVLADRGHDVRVAVDVPSALAAVEAFEPEVVLSDIGLKESPGDGCMLARRLRAAPGGAPLLLVALTGLAGPGDRERIRAAGFDHHLVKPLDLAALERLLGERFAGGDGASPPGAR